MSSTLLGKSRGKVAIKSLLFSEGAVSMGRLYILFIFSRRDLSSLLTSSSAGFTLVGTNQSRASRTRDINQPIIELYYNQVTLNLNHTFIHTLISRGIRVDSNVGLFEDKANRGPIETLYYRVQEQESEAEKI